MRAALRHRKDRRRARSRRRAGQGTRLALPSLTAGADRAGIRQCLAGPRPVLRVNGHGASDQTGTGSETFVLVSGHADRCERARRAEEVCGCPVERRRVLDPFMHRHGLCSTRSQQGAQERTACRPAPARQAGRVHRSTTIFRGRRRYWSVEDLSGAGCGRPR